jgi:hypothetical protein
LNIQEYIQDKLGLPDYPNHTASDNATYNFVRDRMWTVQLHVADCVRTFFDDVGTNLGADFGLGDVRIGTYDRLLLADEFTVGVILNRLYPNIANILSHRSPLLGSPLLDIFNEDLADHVASHNFEQYEDEDWFAQEFDLLEDLQDVLLGPEHTTKDEVSDLLTATDPLTPPCDICGDTGIAMRKLKKCRHLMCDNCLAAQLDTQHPCRYKCPFCRANFFSSD